MVGEDAAQLILDLTPAIHLATVEANYHGVSGKALSEGHRITPVPGAKDVKVQALS